MSDIDEALAALNRVSDGEYIETGHDCYYVCPDKSDIDTIRQALEQHRVPEGWKLVPTRATDEMLDAGAEAECPPGCNGLIEQLEVAYEAMLAATPEPDNGDRE